MPAIADITLTSTEVFEPVRMDSWAHYGPTAELNKTLTISNKTTPAGTLVVEVKTSSPLERTVDSVVVASGFNSSATKFNFNSASTVAEAQAEVQEVIDVLVAHKANIASGKSFY